MSRYIDANEVKRQIQKATEGQNDVMKVFLNAMYRIDKIPTADVRENVRGEWRTTYLDHVAMGERPKILYCSFCNQCIAYPTNFCPNCGAEMRGNHET